MTKSETLGMLIDASGLCDIACVRAVHDPLGSWSGDTLSDVTSDASEWFDIPARSGSYELGEVPSEKS